MSESKDHTVVRGRLMRAVPEDVLDTTVIGSYCQWLAEKHGHKFSSYQDLWQWSVDHLEDFWRSIIEFYQLNVGLSSDDLQRTGSVLAKNQMPGASWLPEAKLSYPEHILRNLTNQTALVGVSQTRGRITLTGDELAEQVARCAQGLKGQGITRGDVVAAYLPNIPETIVAFLATASLGAIWVSCAPEFGTKAIIDRLCQVKPKVLLAVAGYTYGDKILDRREHLASICEALPSLDQVVDVPYQAELAIEEAMSWQQLLASYEPLVCEKVSFDHPLYILFSSGTTGLPKAIVHGHGGILLEHLKAVGLHNDVRQGDSFFWFSTTGWMLWNYSVSALLLGARVVCFDGNPMWPDAKALWQMAADEKVTFFGNSATFYMSCREQKLAPERDFDLSHIRAIGSTGSTLPKEGFDWLDQQFGPRVVINSAAGGTDVCSAFVGGSPMVPIRSGEIASPVLGCEVAALDEDKNQVINKPGELVVKTPMPSMPVCFWGDEDGSRLRAAYYDQNPGCWTHGDWIIIYEDGACTITGRSDATLNRGGVRLGTADFYSVVEEIAGVQDSLVVHLEDASGGMGQLILFLAAQTDLNDEQKQQLTVLIKQQLKSELSPRHIPDQIVWLSAIPRTLTGKKIEAPVKKMLKGTPIEKVATPGSLRYPEVLQEILDWQVNQTA